MTTSRFEGTRIMKSGLLLLLGIAVLLSACANYRSEAVHDLPPAALEHRASEITKIIRGTTSPDGRWAVAVGMPDGSVPVWEVVHDADGGDDTYYVNLDYEISNYLVDLKQDRIVAVLGSCHWGTIKSYNHQHLQILWSPDGRWLAVGHHWKWHTSVSEVHRIGHKGIERSHDLMPFCEEGLMECYVNHQPLISEWKFGDYVMMTMFIGVDNQGEVDIEVSGQVPKQDAPLLAKRMRLNAS